MSTDFLELWCSLIGRVVLREGAWSVLTSFLLFLQVLFYFLGGCRRCPYALASEGVDGRSLKKCFIQLFLSKYCQGILTVEVTV